MPDQETTSALRVVSFQADIKPLFRASDRAAMQKAFDLWSFSDVSAYGTNIAERLQAGTMPCDWPLTASRSGRPVHRLARRRIQALTARRDLRRGHGAFSAVAAGRS